MQQQQTSVLLFVKLFPFSLLFFVFEDPLFCLIRKFLKLALVPEESMMTSADGRF